MNNYRSHHHEGCLHSLREGLVRNEGPMNVRKIGVRDKKHRGPERDSNDDLQKILLV